LTLNDRHKPGLAGPSEKHVANRDAVSFGRVLEYLGRVHLAPRQGAVCLDDDVVGATVRDNLPLLTPRMEFDLVDVGWPDFGV
jgi:hypothetical protein